jgi:ketosteroid isomerase-like protein
VNEETVVRRFVSAVERGDADAAFACVRDDVVQIELPSRIRPHGARHDLAAMKEGWAKGAALLASQSYDVKNVVAAGGRVAVELAWRGTTKSGATITADIAMFFDVVDGRIAAIRNYDCYAAG